MTLKNKIYNKVIGIKRLKQKGCRNVGYWKDSMNEEVIMKYDWSKPMRYVTKRYSLEELLKDNSRKEVKK